LRQSIQPARIAFPGAASTYDCYRMNADAT
jgi:hypothetical protein